LIWRRPSGFPQFREVHEINGTQPSPVALLDGAPVRRARRSFLCREVTVVTDLQVPEDAHSSFQMNMELNGPKNSGFIGNAHDRIHSPRKVYCRALSHGGPSGAGGEFGSVDFKTGHKVAAPPLLASAAPGILVILEAARGERQDGTPRALSGIKGPIDRPYRRLSSHEINQVIVMPWPGRQLAV